MHIDSLTSGENNLIFSWWVHLYLVVPGVGVYEDEEFVTCRYFYQQIDPWEGEAILCAGFIEVSEVNADPPFVFLLLHEDGIGEPVGVISLSDEFSLQ